MTTQENIFNIINGPGYWDILTKSRYALNMVFTIRFEEGHQKKEEVRCKIYSYEVVQVMSEAINFVTTIKSSLGEIRVKIYYNAQTRVGWGRKYDEEVKKQTNNEEILKSVFALGAMANSSPTISIDNTISVPGEKNDIVITVNVMHGDPRNSFSLLQISSIKKRLEEYGIPFRTEYSQEDFPQDIDTLIIEGVDLPTVL